MFGDGRESPIELAPIRLRTRYCVADQTFQQRIGCLHLLIDEPAGGAA